MSDRMATGLYLLYDILLMGFSLQSGISLCNYGYQGLQWSTTENIEKRRIISKGLYFKKNAVITHQGSVEALLFYHSSLSKTWERERIFSFQKKNVSKYRERQFSKKRVSYLLTLFCNRNYSFFFNVLGAECSGIYKSSFAQDYERLELPDRFPYLCFWVCGWFGC